MGVVALAVVLCLSWGSVGRADVITRTVGITTVFPEQYDSLSRRAVPFPMPEDGTITSVAMFHDGGSGGMILAVYDNGGDNKPNNRIAITAETATDPSAGWQTIDLITPVEVSTGAKIWLAWVYENEITHRVGGCDPGWGRAKTSSPAKYWADTPRMPATFGSCELGHNGTSSIYANYTPGGGPPDTDPPEPLTATWDSPPSAVDYSTITMTASEATDTSGVQYYFDETSDNPGGTDSGWQMSRTYTDYGLSPETEYTYKIQTRDMSPSNNAGNWSTSESATTDAITPTTSADINGDGNVDIYDLDLFSKQWLDEPPCQTYPEECADLDEENDNVDVEDFTYLADHWGLKGAVVTLVINEFMASNDEAYTDPQGEYDDWIEIYNASDVTIDIGGMYLEDENNRWMIPDDRPGDTTIVPDNYLIIWADGDTGDTPGLHAGFKLDADGDEVSLYGTDGVTLIDTIEFDDQHTDVSYGRYPDVADDWFYMDVAHTTPLVTNDIGMSGAPYFSHPGGTFTGSFELGLTTKSPTADIYYTTNGSEPTTGSTLYTAPFTINLTTWVRARAYEGGQTASRIVSRTYMKLASDVAAFQTNLPIVLLYSHGGNVDIERDYQPVSMVFIDTDETSGITNITDSADFAGLGGMHLRGNTSAGFPKKQYKFETWDENREDDGVNGAIYRDENVSLLGLPSESDWVLQGPYGDKTLMKNYQMFAWSRGIGHYSPRCIFVEAFIDRDGDREIDYNGGTGSTDYRGIYVLMEKNKRDDNRVDIARLEDTGENDCGYLLLKDWGGEGFTTDTYFDHMIFDDPKGDELTTTQKNWIKNHFNEFEAALDGGNYNIPAHADYYGNYIDIDSFVNYHILVELCKDVDGYVLSTLLYKDHGGKITMGPLWDLNGSMGAGYFCSYDPEGWLYEFDKSCTDDCAREYATFPADNPRAYEWYWRLFEDPEFLLKYADNWFHFREIQFDATKMLNDIDFNANLLTTDVAAESAVDRNFTLWDILGRRTWPGYWGCAGKGGDRSYLGGYVGWIKTWLTARLTWMDGEIDSAYGDTPPEIFLNGSPADQGGHANVGDPVTITGGTIYYTTDGSDPRDWGGGIHGDPYSPITLNKSVQIKARIRYASDNWSALNEATFAVGPVAENLRITEMMYHPQDTGDPINDPNAEFIELKNISGSATINLNLVKFTDGIDFTFSVIDLGPGQYIVVAKDLTVFASKYPAFSGTVVGPYIGRLNNADERIELQDAVGQIIHNFGFKDGWYHITDGSGFSLNIIDPTNPDPNSWEYNEYWQPSSVIKGTPGADDTGHVAPNGAIVISEMLTHTDELTYGDWIELHNTTGSSINIGGWFLSDDKNDLMKYEIAADDPRALVGVGEYVVFDAVHDFGNPADPCSHTIFGLSELGETVYLSSGSGGNLTGGYCTKEDFKAAESEVTFGRYTKSAESGYDMDFVAMAGASKGSADTRGARVGPVVVSEIMYHPPSNGYAEYVELHNITDSNVPLYDPANPQNTWKLTDEDEDIDYYFPLGKSIPAHGYLLLVKNLTAFGSEFTAAGGVQVVEWVAGRLSSAGEKIEISKPGNPEPDGFVPYIRLDRVNYSDGGHPEDFHGLPGDPWPAEPDGTGKSLTRISMGTYGNDPANWQSAAATPGW